MNMTRMIGLNLRMTWRGHLSKAKLDSVRSAVTNFEVVLIKPGD